MTVELDRDDLVNLIIGCSGPYYTIMDKYNESSFKDLTEDQLWEIYLDIKKSWK